MRRTILALSAAALALVGCSGSDDAEAERQANEAAAVDVYYLDTIDMLREPFDACGRITDESCADEIARARNGLSAVVGSARDASSTQAQDFGRAAQQAYFELNDWLTNCGASAETPGCVASRPTVSVLDPLVAAVG